MMTIQHVTRETKGYFKAEEEGKQAGRITYSKAGDSMIIIDHTEVSDDFRGRGVGVDLVMAVVEHARANDLKVIPLCPFAKSIFDKTPSIRDVLK